MRVLVTGAAGFLGQALVQRLLGDPHALAQPLTALLLSDRQFDAPATDPRVTQLAGDFSAPDTLAALHAGRPDLVFHLASVPGALAEREPQLGARVNLHASLALLEGLQGAPRVVFASSIAVYGALGPQPASEDAPPAPALSYGAHKWMCEIALADLSRRGRLDGRSLRLPGIVARPPADTGQGSAFMSTLLHTLAAGAAFTCPVSAAATAWWMSCACAVDNLLHAARLPTPGLPAARCWQLPVLHASVEEVVAAARAVWPAAAAARIRYQPDERTEALFGRLPALHTPRARAAGFADDVSLAGLLARAVSASPQPSASWPSPAPSASRSPAPPAPG